MLIKVSKRRYATVCDIETATVYGCCLKSSLGASAEKVFHFLLLMLSENCLMFFAHREDQRCVYILDACVTQDITESDNLSDIFYSVLRLSNQ
jgi:hypothetical protein